VRENDFVRARVSAHVVLPAQNAIAARGTVNVTNYGRAGAGIVNRSIDVTKLQTATGVAIKPVRVVQTKGPVAPGATFGATQELRIYRPLVTAANPLPSPAFNPPLKLDPETPGLASGSLGSGTLPPLVGSDIGGVSPSTGLPPLNNPSLGGPSLGNTVGGTLNGVRGRLGR
jgi:hypothetical protein